jgi:hypothetical protein
MLMKFSRIVHPEILVGKRGNEIGRECIKTATSLIKIKSGGLIISASNQLEKEVASLLEKDSIFLKFTILCKLFKESNSPIYHLGKEFTQTLQKIDKEIPVDILPERFLAYFSFAENSVFDDEGEVEGGYVCIDLGSKLGMNNEYADKRIISLSYISKSSFPLGPIGALTVPLEGKKVTELANGVIVEDFLPPEGKADPKKRHDVFKVLINSVIYLFSENPEIEKALPINQTGLSSNELKRRNKVINLTSLPIIFVNRNYKRTGTYSVDSTWIESFPRWQRCGPSNSRVRLVFVSPHERKYLKGSARG